MSSQVAVQLQQPQPQQQPQPHQSQQSQPQQTQPQQTQTQTQTQPQQQQQPPDCQPSTYHHKNEMFLSQDFSERPEDDMPRIESPNLIRIRTDVMGSKQLMPIVFSCLSVLELFQCEQVSIL